jgi:hypothetical protein
MMRALLFLTALGLTACTEDDPGNDVPGEDFQYEHSVRITSPNQGETVPTAFTILFSAAKDVEGVELDMGGELAATVIVDASGGGSIALTADTGHLRLTLRGFDGQGLAVSQHTVDINVVEAGDPWVSFTSPPDGGTANNPVTFGLDASLGVDEIEVSADGWTIGTIAPGELLTHEFSGTGFAREISAIAFDDGVEVATDAINITVEEGNRTDLSDWNATMVDLLEEYPTDGTYPYEWSDAAGDGTTVDIVYNGEIVADAGPGSGAYCFCVGLTFELYMRSFFQIDEAMGGDGLLNDMDVDEVLDFRADWYVRDLWGAGAVDALEIWGLGEEVTDWSEAVAGDPVQFWRFSGSGHSVIFIDWVTNGSGNITGLEYWSTQSSTDGIGYNIEEFGTGGSDIDPAHFFIGRAWMPQDWVPWW